MVLKLNKANFATQVGITVNAHKIGHAHNFNMGMGKFMGIH